MRELTESASWGRKVHRPFGPKSLLYGDKVINVIYQRRRDVWPNPDEETYIANGDIGIVVGQYKTKKLKIYRMSSRWSLQDSWVPSMDFTPVSLEKKPAILLSWRIA